MLSQLVALLQVAAAVALLKQVVLLLAVLLLAAFHGGSGPEWAAPADGHVDVAHMQLWRA